MENVGSIREVTDESDRDEPSVKIKKDYDDREELLGKTKTDDDRDEPLRKTKTDDNDREEILSKETKRDDGIGSVVASHYNKLEEKGKQHRKESRIYYMRNLNNWIKSMLIQDYVSKLDQSQFKVLDIGCGKGGDLLKWSKYAVGHMVGVDIAETSIDQCKDRYQHLKNKSWNGRTFSAEFYAADCTKTEVKSFFS